MRLEQINERTEEHQYFADQNVEEPASTLRQQLTEACERLETEDERIEPTSNVVEAYHYLRQVGKRPMMESNGIPVLPVSRLEVEQIMKLLNPQHSINHRLQEVVEHLCFLKEMQKIAEQGLLDLEDVFRGAGLFSQNHLEMCFQQLSNLDQT